MIWVTDKTGRFLKRPHFEASELDEECEQIVEDLLQQRTGCVKYPVSTDDLLFALEQLATVDHYADLPSDASGEVWGVTRFPKAGKPEVRISRRLSENPRFENPYRTTITHESAHVRFHGFLFAMTHENPRLFEDDARNSQTCNRAQVESASVRTSALCDRWAEHHTFGHMQTGIGTTTSLRCHSVPEPKDESPGGFGGGAADGNACHSCGVSQVRHLSS